MSIHSSLLSISSLSSLKRCEAFLMGLKARQNNSHSYERCFAAHVYRLHIRYILTTRTQYPFNVAAPIGLDCQGILPTRHARVSPSFRILAALPFVQLRRFPTPASCYPHTSPVGQVFIAGLKSLTELTPTPTIKRQTKMASIKETLEARYRLYLDLTLDEQPMTFEEWLQT